jgi:hypothetical protein
LRDGGDVTFQGVPFENVNQGQLGLRGRDENGELEDVYEWFVGDVACQHIIRSRQCAWFIERLRILGFSQERHDASLRGTREAFEQSGMTWFTLVRFLQFVHEKSDWTTPLMPPRDSDGPISNIREAQLSSYKNRINWCYRQILEGSGTVDHTGFLSPSLVPNSWTGAAIHELFNQELGETLDFDLEGQPNAESSTEENKQPVVTVEDPIAKKNRQLTEILGILENKAEKSEIGEGTYKEYADLLMSFHSMQSFIFYSF